MDISTIAICIPAYNASDYLPRLLTSVNNQLIPFSDVLVYDDCSTDNTREIAEKYGARVFSGADNKGCSYGKNFLAGKTQSDYIHFHDADDDILPTFTTIAQKWMNDPDSPDVILLNFEYRDYVANELLGGPAYNLKMMEDDPIRFTITHKLVNFGIYKRISFLKAGGFNPDKRVLYNEDAAFHHRLSISGLSFKYEPGLTCINYRYDNSMSASNINKCHEAKYYVTENLLAANLHTIYPNEISNIYWQLATSFASVKNWLFTKKAIKKAIMISNRRIPDCERNYFLKYLCFIDPFIAHYLREYFIRFFKSHLRQ